MVGTDMQYMTLESLVELTTLSTKECVYGVVSCNHTGYSKFYDYEPNSGIIMYEQDYTHGTV